MKVGYLYPSSTQNKLTWSGLVWNIRCAIRDNGIDLVDMDQLTPAVDYYTRISLLMFRLFKPGTYVPNVEARWLGRYKKNIESFLSFNTSITHLVIPSSLPVPALQTDTKIIVWQDSIIQQCFRDYAQYADVSTRSKKAWINCEIKTLKSAKRACFASQWAADAAVNEYGIEEEKVYVLPFGANSSLALEKNQVDQVIKSKNNSKCRLLFIGKEWERKGGKAVVETCKLLIASGVDTELTIIGCRPSLADTNNVPIRYLGSLNQHDTVERELLIQELRSANFLFMPSVAECFGIVYVEASANALPSIARDVGGVSSAIKNHVNGVLVASNAKASDFRDVICRLLAHRNDYNDLCRSSYKHFSENLNWDTLGQRFANIIRHSC